MTGETTKKNTEKDFTELICESCGAEFSCGANVGKCWCFEVEPDRQTLAEIKENFERCLCADCLNNLPAMKS